MKERKLRISDFKEEVERTDMNELNTVHHLKLTVRGSRQKIDFFNHVLGDFDSDWPFTKGKTLKQCKVCDGVEYKTPYFDTKQIKSLGKQINAMSELPGHLKVKVKKFAKAATCLAKYQVMAGRR